MKRIALALLAVLILSAFSGCNSSSESGRRYNDERIVSSTISYYSSKEQKRITRNLSDQELDEYLNLFAEAKETVSFREEPLIGWTQPDVVISIETENIFYYHYYQPFSGNFSESNERHCLFPFDSDLIKEVRKLSEGTAEKRTLSDDSIPPFELISDVPDRTVYLIKGSVQAEALLSQLGSEIDDQSISFTDYFRSRLNGKQIDINDEVTAGDVRYLCISLDPYFFEGILELPVLNRNFINIRRTDCYVSNDDCYVEIETGDFSCGGTVEFEVGAVAYDEKGNEVAGFTERKSVAENRTVRFSSESSREGSDYEKTDNCTVRLKIYCDGILRFIGQPWSFLGAEIISGWQDQYSESIRYAYRLQHELYDQQGGWFEFHGPWRGDFRIGFMEMIRHENGRYEFIIDAEPVFRIGYHLESIGLYHEDGQPYVTEDGMTQIMELGYDWENDSDYQNLVYVVTADRGPAGLNVILKYNQGKTAVLALDYPFCDTRMQKYLGRDDIESVREKGSYQNVFTLDKFDQTLYYRNDCVPSACGIRTMERERALEILSGKSREQIEAILGSALGKDGKYEIYRGTDALDEIRILYEKEKVTDVDYINVLECGVNYANKNNIVIGALNSERNGPITVNILHKNYSKNTIKKLQTPGTVIRLRYRGRYVNDLGDDFELEIVDG
ncbi:MAG: hypothetical protein II126_04080 [Erysipelotrichaceae bacterium]|nr:hypothetical protein [Erysipelotrichaceae bacterium]